MERELRRLRRAVANNSAEENKNVTAAFDPIYNKYDEIIKILKAHVKSYGAAIVDNRVRFAALQKKVDERQIRRGIGT